jgi:hypothetical protein
MTEYIETGSQTYPIYSPLASAVVPMNKIYNGLATAKANFDATHYFSPYYFDYTAAVYQAINYCAYKNRDENKNGTIDSAEIKWYLPSQAQLMAMWITYESYRVSQAKPYFPAAEPYWSSTNNSLYPQEAQYLNFNYGNTGHYYRNRRNFARCVRNYGTPASMVATTSGVANYADLNFSSLPAGAITTTHKSNGVSTENVGNNLTVYQNLSVSYSDESIGETTWSAANTACTGKGANYRLPTQRELQAIWMLQTEIKSKHNSFNLLSDMYYWSATQSSAYSTKAWVVWGSRYTTTPGYSDPGSSGNTPVIEMDDSYARARVRCVYER